MRTILLAVLLVLASLVVSASAEASTGPQACIGAPADNPTALYPETRQFVDGQSWWTQAGDLEPRHLHVGACIPEREQLSGTIHFDVKVQLHANPGKVTYVALVWEGPSGDTTYQSVNPAWTCPTLGNCAFWKSFDIPASTWTNSGLEGFRLRATARQPDGKEMRASLNFQNYVNNGKSVGNVTRMPYLRGKGWYTGLNYCEAAARTDLAPLPDAPLTGVWSPWIRQIDHGTDDANPTHHDIRLDPNIHGGIPGTFLVDAAGSRDGPISVDTDTLEAGRHTLFSKTDCETSAGLNSGVLVVPFVK